MAISSKIKRAIWEGLGELEAPNTFIGRGGEEYTTAMELAMAMDIPYVAIKNFRVDENYNISCRIDREYNITTGAFSKYMDANHKFERYYIDTDGFLKETNARTFASNGGIKFYFPGLEFWGSQTNGHLTSVPGPVILYAKNLENVFQGSTIGEGYFAHNWRNGFGRAYIPNFNPPHENLNQWINFQQNNNSSAKCVAYVNADFYAHPRTAWARTKSGVKLDARIVTNLDCPNAVTDLSVSVNDYDGLTKTSPNGWDAEATAEEMLVGDGTVSMKAIEADSNRILGIETAQGSYIDDFDFAIQFSASGNIAVREGTNPITNITNYNTGDIISIKRTGTLIEYQKNGVTIHTSTTPAPLTDMRIRTIAHTQGATVYDARVGNTPITWRNIVNFHNGITDVILNFTTPAPSTNPIDFYEVWLEELGVNQPEYRYFPHSEITASGHIIRNLKENTNYVLRLATVDTLFNGSGMHSDVNMRRFSNQVTFQTL